jgi:hypothetical protein
MAQDQSPDAPSPGKQADGDEGTRSGRPNPQTPPDHPDEHKSGYGGDGGKPKRGAK